MAHAGEAGLESFRLSRNKISTLARIATAFASGELSEDEVALLPDEAAIERLTSLKGVGTWTAETALLRGLGRPDAYPAGDLSVVKYLAETLFEHGRRGTETEMRTLRRKVASLERTGIGVRIGRNSPGDRHDGAAPV